jgi:hypothetical protein
MAQYALYKVGLETGHYKRTESREPETGQPFAIPHYLFSLPDHDQLRQILGKDGQRSLLAEADEIVSGKFRMFGGEPVPLHLTGDWPQIHWTLFESGKVRLEGDIKYIWEPARFGWAFVLGRAYHLSQNETYAESFWKYFELFTKANPPYLGPHWMNGQEVAIRLMALVWADQVFETATVSSPERSARLAQSVAAHAARIPVTLLYARAQNNNHLLSEAAGLYTAAQALPDHPQAGHWRRLGLKWLDWCFTHQIDGKGEYIQHSTNYQRLMLQLALWIASFAEEGPRFARDKRLASAIRWLAALTDPISGQAANLGANDGAYIFPLANGDFRDFRPVVQAASRRFLGAGTFEQGAWDEMSLWFGEAGSKPRQEAQDILPEYPVIRTGNSWGLLRAADGNLRLAHADLLHVDLWWCGLNITFDPGTYLYNGEPPWDNPWPATRFHNTVTINQADQMTRAGRFLYLDWAKADWGYGADLNRGEQEIHASHNGYHKFGLWHRRSLIRAETRWMVLDHIYPISAKMALPFNARLHWLLPDWRWKIETRERGVEIRLKSPHGSMVLVLKAEPLPSHFHSQLSLIRAGEVVYGNREARPDEGWVSPTYGSKAPALSLAFENQNISEAFFVTEFVFPALCEKLQV